MARPRLLGAIIRTVATGGWEEDDDACATIEGGEERCSKQLGWNNSVAMVANEMKFSHKRKTGAKT